MLQATVQLLQQTDHQADQFAQFSLEVLGVGVGAEAPWGVAQHPSHLGNAQTQGPGQAHRVEAPALGVVAFDQGVAQGGGHTSSLAPFPFYVKNCSLAAFRQ